MSLLDCINTKGISGAWNQVYSENGITKMTNKGTYQSLVGVTGSTGPYLGIKSMTGSTGIEIIVDDFGNILIGNIFAGGTGSHKILCCRCCHPFFSPVYGEWLSGKRSSGFA